MATNNISRASADSVDAWIPEMWAPEVLVKLRSLLVAVPHTDRRWDKPNLKKGDTIHVPTQNSLFTSRNKSTNTAVTFETFQETNTNILIDQHKYSAIRIEDVAELETDVNLRSFYTKELVYPLHLAMDDLVVGMFDDFTTNTVGTAGVALSEDQIMSCYQKLLEAEVEVTPATCSWIVSPAEFVNLYKNNNFIDRNKATNIFSDIPGGRGYSGVLMNASVYVTTNCDAQGTGRDMTLMSNEAIAFVMQRMPRLSTDYDIFHLADVVVLDTVYGALEMRDDNGVFISGA